MTNSEKIKHYVKKEKVKEAQDFIFSLSTAELKELKPTVLELCDKLINYKHSGYGIATPIEREILNLVAALCLTKKEFNKYFYGWCFSRHAELSRKILDSGKVRWFLNFIAKENFFSYTELIQFAKDGYFETDNEKLTGLLVREICNYNHHRTGTEVEYTLQNLEIFPETLEQHIWHLFEYETQINHVDDQRYQSGRYEHPLWKYTFKTLSDAQKIDRSRLLKQSLLTANRNFNKTLTGWFFDTFLYLEPSDDELIIVQPELFNVLSSPHSKVVNGVLKIFKTLALHEQFEVEDFLDNTQVLLTSETKSIATATLMIFDKLIKKNKELKAELVDHAVIALSNQHKNVQLRAAKFIAKHGDAQNEDLKADISSYAGELFADCTALLSDFILENEVMRLDETIEVEAWNIISEENKIPELESVEDFIFLASEAFDNNEPYHFDYLLQGLLDFQDELNDEKILLQFAPAFQRAYKTIFDEWGRNTGITDRVLATFFIDYGKHILLKKYPEKKLIDLYNSHKKQDDKADKEYSWYTKKMVHLRDFVVSKTDGNAYYKPFKAMARLTYDHLAKSRRIQLLSTPTHTPYWIEPLILVKRIQTAVEEKYPIDELDLCLAISRCSMQEKDLATALPYAEKHLSGDFKTLMTYLLNPEAKPTTTATLKEPMLQAYFNKKQSISSEQWKLLKEVEGLDKIEGNIQIAPGSVANQSKHYNYQTQKEEPYTWYNKKLNLNYKKHVLKNKILRVFKGNPIKHLPLLYLNPSQYYSHESAGITRMFSLSPNNTEMLFYYMLKNTYDGDYLWDGEDERINASFLEALLESPQTPGKAGHLIIACSLLAKPKSVRSLAAAYWTQLISGNQLDSICLGRQIGKIQAIEMFPLKRMTDIIIEQMLNISQEHNKALIIMIENMIPLMSEKPIKNTKKLLEILTELRSKYATHKLPDAVKAKLAAWSGSPSIKKLVVSLAA